jgi:hypothetical protein
MKELGLLHPLDSMQVCQNPSGLMLSDVIACLMRLVALTGLPFSSRCVFWFAFINSTEQVQFS